MPNQYQQYCNKGFYLWKGLLSSDDVNACASDIHRIINCQLKRYHQPSGDLYKDMALLLSTNKDSYLAALRRAAKLASLQRFLTHNHIIEVLDKFNIAIPTVSAEPVLHINSEKLRIPGGYYGFGAHQDWTSIQGSLDVIVVWAPLTKVSIDNFPLLVVPGSHQSGLLQGSITENLFEIDPSSYNVDAFTPIEAIPGDVVFMSGWTIHKTGIDGCNGLRMAASIRFENAAEETFVSRNYPCAYGKTVNRDMITPGFPCVDEVRDVFKYK